MCAKRRFLQHDQLRLQNVKSNNILFVYKSLFYLSCFQVGSRMHKSNIDLYRSIDYFYCNPIQISCGKFRIDL